MVRLLVSEAAAGLSEVDALDVSRRAAASIIQETGVSAGAVGVLPAAARHNGANSLPITVVTTLSRSRGAATLVAVEGWAVAAGAPNTDVAAVVATDAVTAGTATDVAASLGAPAGSDRDVEPGATAALDVGLTDVSVAEGEWARDEAPSPGETLCFGRRLVGVVESSSSLADELVCAAPVCSGLP